MKKLAVVLLISFALLVSLSVLAFAGQQDFEVKNATGVTVEKIYVSETSKDEWEEDVMGQDVLKDGESVEIKFDRDTEACKFDLKAVDEDGDEMIFTGLDLCTISKVTLYWKDGKPYAETE